MAELIEPVEPAGPGELQSLHRQRRGWYLYGWPAMSSRPSW
jgi:hypothetical protein